MKSSTISCVALTLLSSIAAAAPQSYPPNAVVPEAVHVVITGHKEANGTFIMEEAPEEQTSEALQKRDPDEHSISLHKRVGPIVAVIGMASVPAAGIIVKIAIEIGADTIKNIGQWNRARETFTKKTTDEMWRRNPNYNRYPAAICYNKGYHVQHPNKIAGRRSAKFDMGLLHTNYDCMYMEGGNSFYTHSDGGYINLAYVYNKRCTHDRRSGDLYCR